MSGSSALPLAILKCLGIGCRFQSFGDVIKADGVGGLFRGESTCCMRARVNAMLITDGSAESMMM